MRPKPGLADRAIVPPGSQSGRFLKSNRLVAATKTGLRLGKSCFDSIRLREKLYRVSLPAFPGVLLSACADFFPMQPLHGLLPLAGTGSADRLGNRGPCRVQADGGV
jgi:hypothetical protein